MDEFPDTLPPDAMAQDAPQDEGADAFPETLSHEDMAQAPAADFPDTISPAEFNASPHTSTPAGVVARGAAEGAAPGIGGLAAGIKITAATAPFIGGWSIPAGFIGGAAVGMGIGKLQDYMLEKLGLSNPEQVETDRAQHPWLQAGAQMAPSAALLNPTGTLIQRGIGAGIGAGAAAVSDLAQHGDVDPVNVGMGAAFGAAFPALNRAGRRIAGEPRAAETQAQPETPPGGREVAKRVRPEDDPESPHYIPDPDDIGFGSTPENRFDWQAKEPRPPLESEVLPPPWDQHLYDSYSEDVKFAAEQRRQYPESDPIRQFWDDHLSDLMRKEDAGATEYRDEEARWGPATEEGFTHTTSEDMSRANDVTTVAKGVAAENSRTPEVRGAGNPVGSPMHGRIAQRPNEPGRDYRKGLPAPESVAPVIETGLVHSDVQAALKEPHVEDVPRPADQPIHPVEQSAQTLGRMDPMEASRLQRDAQGRALAAVRTRNEGQQAGEAFQPEPVTAAVTPEQQAWMAEAKKTLAPLKRVMAAIEQLPPEQQHAALQRAMKLAEEAHQQEAAKGWRPKVGEVTARSKADAARKQASVDAIKSAWDQYGPGKGALPEAPGEVVGIAQRAMAAARAANNGHDPLITYLPREKPAEYKWLKAARSLAAARQGARDKALREFQTAHALEGETGQNIDAELAMKRRPSVEDVEGSQAKPDTDRIAHEEFDNSAGKESAEFKQHHDRLTNYLNGLSDENWRALNKAHDGDLDLTVKSTSSPQDTMQTLLKELAEIQRKDPPRLQLEAGEPVVKRTPVKTAADLPASEGRRIDPNSPEGKAISAAALARQPKAKATPAPEPEIPAKPAVDGTTMSLADHWAKMLADEGGAVNVGQIARDLSDWMKTGGKAVTNYWHPSVPQPILDYGKQIGMAGTKLNTQLTRLKQQVLANARAAVLPSGKPPLPAEFAAMYRAYEDRDMARLTPEQRTYWDSFVQPLLDKARDAYRELRDTTIKLQLAGHDTMPEQFDNGQGSKQYMPRRLRHGPEDEDVFNPVLNRSLSNWTPSGQEREWFALWDPASGARRIYRLNDDGKMVFYNNRKAGRAQTPPASFEPGQVGSTLTQTIPGMGHNGGPSMGQRVWKVDNATVDELQTHGMGEDAKGKPIPLRFVDNPVIAASDAVVGLRSAVARVRLLDHILSDPAFEQLNVRREKEAEARWGKGNYAKTDLPQLKDRYMPKAMAWAFDDIVKQGFHYGDDSAFARLAQVSQTLLKPFYMLGPEVHVLNELDKFIAGAPMLKSQLPKMPQHIKDAFLSVKNQDATQAEIMDAGGNPMYAHAAVARLMPQIGKAVGEDMSIRPWKYDPLMKAFGANTRDVFDHLYQQSNKLMWWQSDVLYTAMYKAFKAQGLAAREAVHETEKIIDSYVVPTTFGKTLGLGAEYGGLRADIGRRIQQFLTDPITSNFGRFSYGLTKMATNTVKNTLGPNSTPSQRAAGAAQLAMMFVGMPLVYQGLSHMYGMITGNEHSEVEQRGITRMVNTPFAIAKGEKGVNAISQRIWSPSVPIETGLRMWEGKDFAGRPIWDTPGHIAEFLAGQTVSPVRPFSAGVEQGGTGFGVQRFLESNFGLKTPSDAAVKYQTMAPKRQVQQDRRNTRHPRGMIDRGINSLFER